MVIVVGANILKSTYNLKVLFVYTQPYRYHNNNNINRNFPYGNSFLHKLYYSLICPNVSLSTGVFKATRIPASFSFLQFINTLLKAP